MSLAPLAAWRWLASDDGQPLLAAAMAMAEVTPKAITTLRSLGSVDAVRAAVDLAQARRRAAGKFANADALWCDGQAVEQASSERVARWKAQRFAGRTTVDLCSGMGGDLMAISRVAPARGVDLDPVRAWMAERNAGVRVRTGDACDEAVDGALIHIDPARRDERGARMHGLDACVPGISALTRLWNTSVGGGAKLGPGIEWPIEAAPEDHELEFISEGRTLVQAMLWWGACARHPGMHSATALRAGEVRTMHGCAERLPIRDGAYGAWIAVPDPALERSGLAGASAARLGLAEAAAGLGVAHGPRSDAAHDDSQPSAASECGPRDHPSRTNATNDDDAWWWRWYRVTAEIPWRVEAAARWLHDHDAGEVTVKTRGKAVNPDALARAWRGQGATPWTVFVLRHGDALRAFATTPA